jgi:hypothetical protein
VRSRGFEIRVHCTAANIPESGCEQPLAEQPAPNALPKKNALVLPHWAKTLTLIPRRRSGGSDYCVASSTNTDTVLMTTTDSKSPQHEFTATDRILKAEKRLSGCNKRNTFGSW